VLGFITSHLWAIAAAVAGVVVAALVAYLREQVGAGTEWALAPITRQLPWNQNNTERESDIISQLTIVDIFLTSTDGKSARYQKTSNYIVNKDDLNAYQEGVTSAGRAGGFSTTQGTIVGTKKEHGFYISQIYLGDLRQKGSRFTNTYTADLHDCFTTNEEHWTQEIAFQPNISPFKFTFQKADPRDWSNAKLLKEWPTKRSEQTQKSWKPQEQNPSSGTLKVPS
jgi:hypothetical protein